MERVLKREDIVNELAERTGFYKKNLYVILKELEEVILDNMSMATMDERSEVHLGHGIIVGGKMLPEREVFDPRNLNRVITPTKITPYSKFTTTVKKKINE